MSDLYGFQFVVFHARAEKMVYDLIRRFQHRFIGKAALASHVRDFSSLRFRPKKGAQFFQALNHRGRKLAEHPFFVHAAAIAAVEDIQFAFWHRLTGADPEGGDLLRPGPNVDFRVDNDRRSVFVRQSLMPAARRLLTELRKSLRSGGKAQSAGQRQRGQ